MAIWSEGSKSGMSPGVMRSMARSIAAAAGPDRPKREQPGLLALPVEHPGVVVVGQRADRRLGHDLLPVVPLGDLAGVHDQDHGADALDLQRLDLHVDRQRLLDGRVHPAAGAEAVGPAEHDQPGAHVVAVGRQQLVLGLGERLLGDVGQDHRVIGLELRQVGRQRVAADPVEPSIRGATSTLTSIFFSRRALTSSACSPGVPSIRRTWALPRAWVNPSARLLIARLVALPFAGNELGGEGVEVGLGDELLERLDVHAAIQLDRARLLVAGGRGHGGSVGLLEDLQRPAGRLAGADHDVDVDRLALLHVGGDRDLLDQDLAVVEVFDRQDVDLRRPASWRPAPARAGCRGSRCRRRRRRSAARCPRGRSPGRASRPRRGRCTRGRSVFSIPIRFSSLGAGGTSTRGSWPKTMTPAMSSRRRFFDASVT